MTVKEQIVEIIQSQGYDLLTACELADETIKEFLESGYKSNTYTIGNRRFKLERKQSIQTTVNI